MTTHTIFYYPYGSFKNEQTPLLKAAALYFDKLYILDPVKASWDSIGPGALERDLQLLGNEGILERVLPEEVLSTYETAITESIRADLQDPDFLKLCEERGQGGRWTLALAKVPQDIRNDPKFQPVDKSMQRLMGDISRGLSSELGQYNEVYAEYAERGEVYDEYRESAGNLVEYRYADYPLALGEAIMINHALFGGLLHTGATPLTDDSFHNQVLNLKVERARRIPKVRDVLEDRAKQRQLKQNQLAATALTDIDLGVIPPGMPLEKVLNYRESHKSELEQARNRLGWLAREIREVPWSKEFADELEHGTIPKIHQELKSVKKSWTSLLKAAGLVAGGAATVLSIVSTPLLPVAAVIGALGLAKDVVIPGVEVALDWKQGKQEAGANGLHYLLKIKG